MAPLFNQVQLKCNTTLPRDKIYTVTATNVKDCLGNTIGAINHVKVGLPSEPGTGDLVINEILFDPVVNGFDYVEFYNKSTRILDASKLFIATRNSGGVISSAKTLGSSAFYIFPGDYIVETEDAGRLSLQYLVKNPEKVLVVSSPPSFPNDAGTVVLLNSQGAVVDEVNYKDDWHFKLLSDPEAVSLERIDPGAPSNEPSNWHSAASTAGYGTPTYQNSQFKSLNAINAKIQITPPVFSPDNDGRDDIATIQFEMTGTGWMGSITIFDVSGRPVRFLARNNLLGLKGYYNWDGMDENGKRLPMGSYIALTELFNLQGKKERYKNLVTLVRNKF
jgi:hypothetical protein